MGLRRKLLQAAGKAADPLCDARDRVVAFVGGQFNDDGGARARSGRSDLYYTVFALQCLEALGADIPADRVAPYVRVFGGGDGLDLVHLASLLRARALVRCDEGPGGVGGELARRIDRFRAEDGGYHPAAAQARGTVYAAFLACGAVQDLGLELQNPDGVVRSVRSCRSADGAYANSPGQALGSTPATAAAVTLLADLGGPIDPGAVDWLRQRCDPRGGFRANPLAPAPDLLSTAVALHSLGQAEAPIADLIAPCIDFVDSLWDPRGGFFGHWADGSLDCEYTFYGLLALGHLAP